MNKIRDGYCVRLRRRTKCSPPRSCYGLLNALDQADFQSKSWNPDRSAGHGLAKFPAPSRADTMGGPPGEPRPERLFLPVAFCAGPSRPPPPLGLRAGGRLKLDHRHTRTRETPTSSGIASSRENPRWRRISAVRQPSLLRRIAVPKQSKTPRPCAQRRRLPENCRRITNRATRNRICRKL